METVSGFSKLSKDQKIDWLKNQISCGDEELNAIKSFWHKDNEVQDKLDDFSENTIISSSLIGSTFFSSF